MKTLIFNGSPRKNGDTASLIEILKGHIQGEAVVIDAYNSDVSPCIDCRFCKERSGCSIHDGWDRVNGLLKECDAVVAATPIYFSQPTGQLLSLLSRTQQYFCARRFRGEEPFEKRKRGGIILVGGGDGSPERAAETLRCILKTAGCGDIAPMVCCHRTDLVPAAQEPGVSDELKGLASFLENRQ